MSHSDVFVPISLRSAVEFFVPSTPSGNMARRKLRVGFSSNRNALFHMQYTCPNLRPTVVMKVRHAKGSRAGWKYLQRAYRPPMTGPWPKNMTPKPALKFCKPESIVYVTFTKSGSRFRGDHFGHLTFGGGHGACIYISISRRGWGIAPPLRSFSISSKEVG